MKSEGAAAERGAGAGERRAAVELAVLLAAVLGVLALFLGKAFTIDDTLFLWLGRHLQGEPLDFYGFTVNWYGTNMSMAEVTKNPPLVGYWIAGAAALVGWSERALHLAFLLPAAAACAGTYLLARRLCSAPLLAALLGLLSPVFLISSTNVMCDTTMLAFWCWTLWCWVRGFDTGRARWHLLAGVLAALTILSKYFGVSLVPLLLVHGWLRSREPGEPRRASARWTWAACLAIPLLAMVAYQLATRSLYGRGLLLDAAEYASLQRHAGGAGAASQLYVGLVFAGGCSIAALFLAPALWSARALAAMAALAALGLVVLVRADALGSIGGLGPLDEAGLPTRVEPRVLSLVQAALMAAGGISLLALVAEHLRRNRSPEDVLLGLWVLGTFAFAAIVNWVNNGRSNLPMAPAVGILVVRRLAALERAGRARSATTRWTGVACAALVALLATYADTAWANDVRASAHELAERYARGGHRLLYQGHWGFQYYMDEAGAKPLDYKKSLVRRGDHLVVPRNNTDVFLTEDTPTDTSAFERVEALLRPTPRFARTMSKSLGAGFYASNIGPLPFAFGRSEPDAYLVWRANRDFRLETP